MKKGLWRLLWALGLLGLCACATPQGNAPASDAFFICFQSQWAGEIYKARMGGYRPETEKGTPMIEPLREKDWDAVCAIVNQGWRETYKGYVNPLLLNEAGCRERAGRLKADFASGRLENYVWATQSGPAGLLSLGATADGDSIGALEVWRLYIAPEFQGRGLGGSLLAFAEGRAKALGYETLLLWAFKENRRGLCFYQKQGYRADKEAYLGEPYLAVGLRLKKRLTTA